MNNGVDISWNRNPFECVSFTRVCMCASNKLVCHVRWSWCVRVYVVLIASKMCDNCAVQFLHKTINYSGNLKFVIIKCSLIFDPFFFEYGICAISCGFCWMQINAHLHISGAYWTWKLNTTFDWICALAVSRPQRGHSHFEKKYIQQFVYGFD